MNIKKIGATAFLAVSLFSATGCSTIAQLEANARADRAAHPEKYQEIPEVARQQMSPGQDGAPYPQFCTFGCTEPMDLSRNH
ncbi:TPA: hypothetical protein ACIRVE_005564 [Pseudomonas putida]